MRAGKVIRYIQQSLYEGKQPTNSGFYVFTRKELAEGAKISVSTFDKYKDEVLHYFSTWCDLKSWAKYDEYEGEVLYIDVAYEKGALRFKRNPITLQPHLSYLWALPPLNSFFSYDVFDEKHRRRTNGTMKYDAIPWGWDADLWEHIISDGKSERILTLVHNPPNTLLIKQAEAAYAVMDVILLQEGYTPKNLANSLYRAVDAVLPELCEFLLSHGADPNEIVQQGYSSMQCISGMNKKGENWEQVVRYLIDAGGNLVWGNFNADSFAGNIFSKGSDDLCRYYIDALYKQGLLATVSITNQTPLSVLEIYKDSNSELVKYMKDLLECKN